jgi:hypothetical protein
MGKDKRRLPGLKLCYLLCGEEERLPHFCPHRCELVCEYEECR